MSKGKFIVFEGLDGSGKTTQIKLLEKHLADKGRRVFLTAEPTVSLSGGMLRDALAGLSKKRLQRWRLCLSLTEFFIT